MYFNGKLFLKAEYLALFRQPFRLRRWAYVLLFSVLYLSFLALVVLGRGLDHIFFPRFRRQPVKAPVFIIAPPRSGTTLVQKLISLDRDRFVHLKMYQTILPCICYQRLIDVASALDQKLGGPFRRLLGWCEARWFGGWDEMHKLRLSEPEEDDALFLYAFASEAIFLLFPFVEELWQAGFPDALPPPARKKLMRYYRSCLQRHLFANGPGKTLLSKATQSSGTLESLLEEFPDANFVTIVRHPYESLASHVSLFVPVWQAHSPEIQRDGLVSRAYAKLAIEWYKHLFTFRHRLEPDHYYCIDYRDLQRNPGETIRELYQHFGWPIKEQHNGELELATNRQREFKSKHQYHLSEFGLSKDWIQAELGEVLDAYGLER